MTQVQASFKRKLVGLGVVLAFALFMVTGLTAIKAMNFTPDDPGVMNQSAEQTVQNNYNDPQVIKFAFLAAAIAVGLGSAGAGAAVGYVGAAAMGTIGEKPELAGRALIFVGLAEGIAIYGLIIAIMILGKV